MYRDQGKGTQVVNRNTTIRRPPTTNLTDLGDERAAKHPRANGESRADQNDEYLRAKQVGDTRDALDVAQCG